MTFILLENGNVLYNVISVYRGSHYRSSPHLPSKFDDHFNHFFFPSNIILFLSKILLSPRGEKSTELLIGSVNLDKEVECSDGNGVPVGNVIRVGRKDCTAMELCNFH